MAIETLKDNRLQEYNDWFQISNLNGWLVYKNELEELLKRYDTYMNNLEATGDMLKNCQLIKKGLQMAYDIPKILENKAKSARREMK